MEKWNYINNINKIKICYVELDSYEDKNLKELALQKINVYS